MPALRTASIVIPTRGRPGYLDVALASVMAQATAAGAEALVVLDGPDGGSEAVAERHGARVVALPVPAGLNAARNAGCRAARSDLIVFLDDDVRVDPGWLRALLRRRPPHPGARGPRRPDPSRARGRRAAGVRARAPADHHAGPRRRPTATPSTSGGPTWRCGAAPTSWPARSTSACRDAATRRSGSAGTRHAAGACATSLRRRSCTGATAPTPAWVRCAAAAYALGRTARRNDVRKHAAPAPAGSSCGCWPAAPGTRRGAGAPTGSSWARTAPDESARCWWRAATEARRDRGRTRAFLSGTAGTGERGARGLARAGAATPGPRGCALAAGMPWRLPRAAARWPARRVLVLAVAARRCPQPARSPPERRSERSHHQVDFASRSVGGRGKFENLDDLLGEHPAAGHDWLLVLDDDVALPAGFLGCLHLPGRALRPAPGPARPPRPLPRRLGGHPPPGRERRARDRVCRDRAGRRAARLDLRDPAALSAPALRLGPGSALVGAARQRHGWRLGVVDATPIRHGLRTVAASYGHGDAIAEARGSWPGGRSRRRARPTGRCACTGAGCEPPAGARGHRVLPAGGRPGERRVGPPAGPGRAPGRRRRARARPAPAHPAPVGGALALARPAPGLAGRGPDRPRRARRRAGALRPLPVPAAPNELSELGGVGGAGAAPRPGGCGASSPSTSSTPTTRCPAATPCAAPRRTCR